MLELLKLLVIVGGVLALALMILLALPRCKLREMLMPWAFIAFCIIYALSPIDVVPDVIFPVGVADDLAVVVAGVMTAVKTMRGGKEKISARNDPYFN